MSKKSKASNAKTKIKAYSKILLEIEINDGNDGMTKLLSLSSYVEEVLGDGCLLIHMPMHKGYHYSLPTDKPLLLYFFMNHRMFSITVRSLENIKRDNLLYAKVLLIGEPKPDQRRNCFRFECSLPVTFERHQRSKKDDSQQNEGQMIDLSDGGMLFETNEYIGIGEKISLQFILELDETVEAVVLRSDSHKDGAYKHKVAVQFQCKDKKRKERFFKFIVDKQREKAKQESEEKLNDADGDGML